MNEHLRQRGRTERMLAAATSYSALKREVRVYVHSPGYAQQLSRHPLLRQRPDIKVEAVPEDFDWTKMHNPRLHPNCVCLVDHAAIEVKLQHLDEQALRLDQLRRQLYALTT